MSEREGACMPACHRATVPRGVRYIRQDSNWCLLYRLPNYSKGKYSCGVLFGLQASAAAPGHLLSQEALSELLYILSPIQDLWLEHLTTDGTRTQCPPLLFPV